VFSPDESLDDLELDAGAVYRGFVLIRLTRSLLSWLGADRHISGVGSDYYRSDHEQGGM
jgi:hypothetical protein